MKYARVISNRVNDVCEGDPYKKYVKPLADLFIECPDNVSVGWYYWSDKTFHETREPYWSYTMTALQFMKRFSSEERIAIRTAATTDPYVEDFWEMLQLAETVDVRDNELIAGVQYLAQKDIIEESRVEEILAPELIEGER